eukprot:scaffold647822_cov47-Prasinocladus_malaysianus.AAC.1
MDRDSRQQIALEKHRADIGGSGRAIAEQNCAARPLMQRNGQESGRTPRWRAERRLSAGAESG